MIIWVVLSYACALQIITKGQRHQTTTVSFSTFSHVYRHILLGLVHAQGLAPISHVKHIGCGFVHTARALHGLKA